MTDMISSKLITEDQIGKINDLLSSELRKAGLRRDSFQQVLKFQEEQLVADLLAVIQCYVDSEGELLFRKVTEIDRSLSARQALVATGLKLYVNDRVVAKMQRSQDEVSNYEVFFFNLNGWYMSDDDLEKEYAARGLVPCDPFVLAKVNQDDPSFARKYRNCTHWRRSEGDDWSFIIFDYQDVEQYVAVNLSERWCCDWWFAGVRR